MPGVPVTGEEIRLMEAKDLAEVLEIERSSFLAPWSRRLFEESLGSSITKSFVSLIEGKVVGYAIFYTVESEAHILNVAIHPEYRMRGYGFRLLGKMIDVCKDRGITEVFLEVRESNERAISLYGKYGFMVVGKRKGYYRETKEDALIMYLAME